MQPGARILIVDDSPMVRTMIKRSLNDLGYMDTSEASDGLEALEALTKSCNENRKYDIVFLDWNMPRMTGIELIEKCKGFPELSSIPICMISAERERASVIRAMTLGASDYILKPFTTTMISEKLESLLRSHETTKVSGQ